MLKQSIDKLKVSRICLILLVIYLALVIVFYYLAGYQLRFRESYGDFSMPQAESGTVELTQGTVVTQNFNVKIQRLKSITVEWGTYYRTNVGTVSIELIDLSDGAVVMVQTYDVATITEGGVTQLAADEPIETLYGVPLQLRITADSLPGQAVSPMMASTAREGGFVLFLNGVETPGVLCISVSGEDYIWTGLHYWQFATVFGAAIALYLLIVYYRWKKGKRSFLLNAVLAINKYWFLIKQLVSRDFKTKYKRSILGVLWSFLNPLLSMIVQYLVFSNLFRFDIPYYPVYLLCGIVIFNFFAEASNMALGSIVGNAGLITKVYVPKYIYPLTRTISSVINLLISLIPLFAVALIAGIFPTKAYFLLPFMLACLAVFTLGFGMLLASSMVFFRDTQFLWGILNMIWMYITPIFYPESILPESIAWVLKCNPLYYFIKFARTIIIEGVSPEPIIYFQCFMFALGTLVLGAFVFKKCQDKFVLYI